MKYDYEGISLKKKEQNGYTPISFSPITKNQI
jgi:hypothetical protein